MAFHHLQRRAKVGGASIDGRCCLTPSEAGGLSLRSLKSSLLWQDSQNPLELIRKIDPLSHMANHTFIIIHIHYMTIYDP